MADAPALCAALVAAVVVAGGGADPVSGPGLAGLAVDAGRSAMTAKARASVDTTVAVRRGDRLVLLRARNDLVIETWDRDAVRVRDDEEPGESDLTIGGNGDALTVRWGSRADDVVVTVPRWLPVEIEGLELDASVDGLEGGLSLAYAGGGVVLRDVGGAVSVASADGELTVSGGTGQLSVRAGDDIDVVGFEGRIEVETTYGDITLRGVDLSFLGATTTDGDIVFSGPLQAEGSYTMISHSGDLQIDLDEGEGASFQVVTYEGELETEVPMRTERFSSGAVSRFTVGAGSATVVLETFSGDILVRSGAR